MSDLGRLPVVSANLDMKPLVPAQLALMRAAAAAAEEPPIQCLAAALSAEAVWEEASEASAGVLLVAL